MKWMTDSRITVRYASGDVEHRYGSTLPNVGDRLGRNGDEGFVISVEADGRDATVTVGTPASQGISWDDLTGPRDGETAKARERILEAAYELFSKRGIHAVGTEEVLARAAVAKSTLYRHFSLRKKSSSWRSCNAESSAGRVISSKPRHGDGDRRRGSVCSRYSTCSTDGFIETTSKDARSSTCSWRWEIWTVRSERQARHI